MSLHKLEVDVDNADTMTFSLIRESLGCTESIRLTFDHSDMDIHQVVQRFAHFLMSVQYAPESIQKGFDDFDIEEV